MSTVTPFAEGKTAYRVQRQREKNPYPLGSNKWLRWNSGYESARLAARKAQQAADLEAIESRPLDSWVTQEAENG